MVLLVAYVFLGMICSCQTGYFSMVTKEYHLYQRDDHLLNETLCLHCVHWHVGLDRLQKPIERQKFHQKRDEALKAIRASCNSISIVNSLTIFLTFGGRKSITLITLLFSSICIVGSIFIETMAEVIFFESVVALVFFCRASDNRHCPLQSVNPSREKKESLRLCQIELTLIF